MELLWSIHLKIISLLLEPNLTFILLNNETHEKDKHDSPSESQFDSRYPWEPVAVFQDSHLRSCYQYALLNETFDNFNNVIVSTPPT